MQISKRILSTILAASVAAGGLAPLSIAAQAGGDVIESYDHVYDYDDDYRDERRVYRKYHRYCDYECRRDKRDRRIARGLALGIGALAVGAIIAGSSHRHHHRHYGH